MAAAINPILVLLIGAFLATTTTGGTGQIQRLLDLALDALRPRDSATR